MATLIVVDSNASDRRLFLTLLGNFGHRVLEAEDGLAGLEMAKTDLPDLVITDILMPRMDGFTLVRRLRAEPLLAGVPVIFQTANYQESEVRRLAQASGIRFILSKPADPQEILRTVNAALKQPTVPSRLPQTGQLQRDHLQLLADKLYQKVSELEQANERLRTLSLSDELTSLNNRRGFMILATGLLKFAQRANHPLCLLYIDMDRLKYINDTFGHAQGDASLVDFSRILLETFRDSDVVARLGGDEFVILTIDATQSDLYNIQNRLQDNVTAYNIRAANGRALSFSLGVLQVDIQASITMEQLLNQADAAMYKHKQSRKRVPG
jgi:diguanylate cyclase (GGDEF)-like protein